MVNFSGFLSCASCWALLKKLGIEIKVKNKRIGAKEPNSETFAATQELKEGKGKRFDNVEALFESV